MSPAFVRVENLGKRYPDARGRLGDPVFEHLHFEIDRGEFVAVIGHSGCGKTTILTGMRISMGIAWLVIVAAEMLVGGTGIGYFVWNEWNNLALPSMLFAIFLIGVVGMLLDLCFARLQRAVTYAE